MDWDEIYDREKAQGVGGGQSFFESEGASSSSGRRNNNALAGLDDDDDMDMDGIVPGRNPPPAGGMGIRRGGGERRGDLFPENETVETPLEKLTRHWVNERYAPDILPAQEELLGGLLDHLRVQVRFLLHFPGDYLNHFLHLPSRHGIFRCSETILKHLNRSIYELCSSKQKSSVSSLS